MKNLLLIAFSALAISSFGQTDSASKTKKIVPYHAIIRTMDGGKTKGWLYKIDDNNIYLLPGSSHKKLSPADLKSTKLNMSAMNFDISQKQGSKYGQIYQSTHSWIIAKIMERPSQWFRILGRVKMQRTKQGLKHIY